MSLRQASVQTSPVTFADAGCAWSASVDVPWLTFTAADNASAYAHAVLADHPVGYWPLAEISGATIVADASGFGHDGVVTAGVALGHPGARADGRTAAVFDGTSGAVVIPPGAISDLGAVTWEAWVKVASVAGARRDLVSLGGSGGSARRRPRAMGLAFVQLEYA